MQNIKAALLDVDGTLVDSNDAHAHAWVKALAQHGITVPFAAVRRLIGKGGDKLLPEVSGIAADSPEGEAISRARQAIFEREYLPNLRPFPRARDLVARMQASGLRLAVASSAKKDELAKLLHVCGVDDLLETKTSSDDADNSKPDPDIVQAALKKLALAPAHVLLLGDTPYDVEAGLRSGVGVVALRCGGWADPELAGATGIYDDPAGLLVRYEASPFAGAT